MVNRVAVIGGGLGGLMAGTLAARAGAEVTVYERSAAVGGRARTTRQRGFHVNLGPHALYVAGPAAALLRELGVPWSGGSPRLPGLRIWRPAGATSRGYWQLARFVASACFGARRRLDGQTVDAWMADHLDDPGARRVAEALVRTVSYTADPDADAARMADQVALGLQGVRYLDGGWQSLVDGLRRVAGDAGVAVRTGEPVRRVGPGAIELDDRVVDVDSTILAVDPATAAALVPGSEHLQRTAERAEPVRAACLDVALTEVPRPARTFAVGFSEPTYVSLHSAAGALAPPGGGVVHALWYRGQGAAEALDPRRALEATLDDVQPGWRDAVDQVQYLPRMTVAHDRMRADPPTSEVPDAPGIWLVGDWVGGEGWLLDAVASSARRAVEGLVERAT